MVTRVFFHRNWISGCQRKKHDIDDMSNQIMWLKSTILHLRIYESKSKLIVFWANWIIPNLATPKRSSVRLSVLHHIESSWAASCWASTYTQFLSSQKSHDLIVINPASPFRKKLPRKKHTQNQIFNLPINFGWQLHSQELTVRLWN